MLEITAKELKELIDKKVDFQLIDVREPHEFDDMNLKGELIPMGDVMDNADKIAKDKQVVIHCRLVKRKAAVIQAIEMQLCYKNL